MSVSSDFIEDEEEEEEKEVREIDGNLTIVDAVEETYISAESNMIPTFSDTIICYSIVSGLVSN